MENFDQLELEKFSKLADQWWDPNGKFKPSTPRGHNRGLALGRCFCAAVANHATDALAERTTTTWCPFAVSTHARASNFHFEWICVQIFARGLLCVAGSRLS